MKTIGLILLAWSLSALYCTPPSRAEFEVTLDESSAIDSAEWDRTLGVLGKRIEKIAEGRFDFTPAGAGKYTLCLHTSLTDRELEYVLTSPGRLEFWEPCYWNCDMMDILLWGRNLREEEYTESNHHSKMLASYIPYRASDSDPCALEGIPAEAYPVVTTMLDSLKATGVIPGEIRFGRRTRKDAFGNDVYTVYLLKSAVMLNGTVFGNAFIEKISYAAPSRKRYFPELNIVFNQAGAELWKEITYENIGKHLALTFDGEILMVPQIYTLIENGEISVSAGTETDEAGVSILKCIPAIVGSGVLTLPVGCRRI